jgi:plastocyanin
MDFQNQNRGGLMKVLGVILILIVVVIVVWLIGGKGGISPDVFRPSNPLALPTVEGGTREVIRDSIDTPSELAANLPANIAIPMDVSPLGKGEQTLREFAVTGEAGRYVPDTIVANDGDVVTVSFTASDANYNMFFPDFGVYQTVSRGETKRFQFQVYPFGQYQFYCKDICAGNMEGTLVVNK